MEKKSNTEIPTGATVEGNVYIYENGVTKREYFAALAMQGLLTRVPKRHGDETDLGIIEARRIAAESRIMADLLIAELNEGGNNE